MRNERRSPHRRTWGLFLALIFFCLTGAGAQEDTENLDDLFNDPVPDEVAAAPIVDHLAGYVQKDTVTVSGSFNAKGGLLAGWKTWPVLSDLSLGFDGNVGLTAKANLYLDARPDPDFRLYGAFSSSVNPLEKVYAWPQFAISELFVDYTLMGTLLVRLGQHGMTWGQGRLFEGITNIMSDAGGSFSLRASLPALLNGVSAVALINRDDIVSYQQACYAAKADIVVLETMLSLGARIQLDDGLKALFSLKKVLWGVDLLADVAIHKVGEDWNPRVLAGFFKEWEYAKLYGEYYGDGTSDGGFAHIAGLAFGYKDILGTPLDLGIKWLHAFADQSGSVTPAVVWSPWNHLSANVAAPFVYGPEDGRYVTSNNPDGAKRRIVIVFGLELSASF